MWLPLLFELGAAASPAPAPEANPWLRELAQRVDLYGRFDGHLAFSESGVDFANNGSRFGIKAEQPLPLGWSIFGCGEWGVKLGQGDTEYNITNNPDTGFATFQATDTAAIGTRLGFVGLRLGAAGTLTFGKQWSVYYDVSKWGDVYTVFGTRGSSTFNAGTDGGPTGGGRANDAVVYRLELGALKLGAQAQFLDAAPSTVDGFGGSLVYDIGSGIHIGAAYSHSVLDIDTNIAGFSGGDAQALTGGISFDGEGWRVSALDTWTHNHELVGTESATVMYDTWGAELFVGRRFDDTLMLYGGFDFAIPRDLDTRYVNPNFGTRDVIGGVRWLLGLPPTDGDVTSFVYLEGRSGQTRDASGARAEEVVMLGLRLGYSLRQSLGFDS